MRIPRNLNRTHRPARILAAGAAALLVLCGSRAGWTAPDRVTLVVGAAASTAAVMGDVAEAFTAWQPEVSLRFHHAASGALLQQIEHGAPMHAVVFADRETIETARRRGVELSLERLVAQNRLLLAAPSGRAQPLTSLRDLAGDGVRRVCIGNPAYVPLGRYAARALKQMGLWEPLQGKLVLAGSAAQVRQYVRRADVDAAVLYGSDAVLLGDAVEVVADLTEVAAPQYFAAVLVSGGAAEAAANRFVEFLASPSARELFVRRGFHAAGRTSP